VANTATGSGQPPNGNRVSDDDDATIPSEPDPKIELVKTVSDSNDAGTTASLGEVLTYTFTVKNTGDVPLSDIRIIDSKLWTGTEPCTDTSPLTVGESRVCLTFTYTVTAADLLDPNVVNTATGSGQPPNGNRVSDDDDATIPTVPASNDANLSIKKTVNVSQAAPGDTVTYTLTVKNTGPGDAADVIVTDNLPSGTTFVSATSPCTNAGGTITCSLGTLGAGDITIITIKVKVAPIAGGDTSHQHQLDYTKVESHLSLFDGDTLSATASCPTGYFATDGSVRLDHVDQGAGTFEDAVVLASGVTPDGTSWTGKVRNDATGQVQAKVNVVCMTGKTTSGDGHSHDVVVDGPVGSSETFAAAGRYDVDLTCGPGYYAITPSFAFIAGEGVVSTRRLADGGWRFTVDVDDPAAGTFSTQCLSTSLATAQGHSHELRFTELTDTVTVPAGEVKEVQLTCPVGYKGIVAWADMDPGLLTLGNDPQPITRVFRFYNPTGGPLTADYGLLCVAIRTTGSGNSGGDITNTASVSTTSHDTSDADNQSSATFTVGAVNALGVTVRSQASVLTQSGRTLVALKVKAVGKRTVTFRLFAGGKARGTQIRAGSLLARKGVKLSKGRAMVRLVATPAASKAFRQGKISRAKLVITSNGAKDVRWVRIRG
ncbi:MAG: DUF11 domain-containing protein, partial [Nocardioides sp.]|nr:DUF11 domain-containing protein [Nocardioides sp.]